MSDRLRDLFKDFFSGGPTDFPKLRKELAKPENDGALRELSQMKYLFSANPVMDKEKMWAEISRHRNAGRLRRTAGKIFRYAAVFMLPALIAGALWYTGVLRPDAGEAVAQIEPGRKQALIWIENEEYVDITGISSDTVIKRDNYSIRLTTEGAISYEFEGGDPGETERVPADRQATTNTVFIPRGGEHSLTLPDGSRVWLNSETELRFPVPFDDGKRKVTLAGEAYFDVAHDRERPFIVETGDISLQVLGTKFNVKSYRNELIQTTLAEGAVGISYDQYEYVVLTPGKQFIYHDGHAVMRDVDVQMHTAWMKGRFYFDSTSLEEISRQMERWYDITFVFADSSLKEEKFTGVIERNSTANSVMTILEKIIDIQYDIKDRTIYVFRKKHIPANRALS